MIIETQEHPSYCQQYGHEGIFFKIMNDEEIIRAGSPYQSKIIRTGMRWAPWMARFAPIFSSTGCWPNCDRSANTEPTWRVAQRKINHGLRIPTKFQFAGRRIGHAV